jgi:hypothetical protein
LYLHLFAIIDDAIKKLFAVPGQLCGAHNHGLNLPSLAVPHKVNWPSKNSQATSLRVFLL